MDSKVHRFTCKQTAASSTHVGVCVCVCVCVYVCIDLLALVCSSIDTVSVV